MTIDIHPGDTFTIWTNGAILQYRNDTTRWLGDDVWATGSTSRCHDERELCPATARQIILAAGHTITEAEPQPTPVPWPTHAVLDCTGALVAFGDAKTCNAYSNAEVSAVRPLAPAPLSPAMVTLLKALDDYFHQQPMLAATCINVSIRNLLAEGGAA
jgi:hypothetical protein